MHYVSGFEIIKVELKANESNYQDVQADLNNNNKKPRDENLRNEWQNY